MAELKIISMDEVAVEEVEWLWYPYIPYGKLTIIHGDGGEGKTTLILRLAALLSKGEKLPCDDTEREPIKVIYQTAEDGLGDTIKPRLLAGNADCSQIKVIDESEAALTMLDERVEKAIAETGARVMILDPMQAYIGAKVDMNRANEVRTILSQLGRIADKYRCAIILVGHLNKAQGNKSNYKKRRVWVSPNECLMKQRILCACDLLRKAVGGIGNYPKKMRVATCKVATLQRCGAFAILQCSFSAGMPIRSLGGVQGALFKGRLCWGVVRRQRGNAPQPPRRAQ